MDQAPVAIHEKCRLYKITLENSLNNLQSTTNSNNKPLEGEGIRFHELPNYNIQIVQFSTKNYEACKEIRKYSPFTEKKEMNRLGPWGSPSIGLKQTILNTQRAKGNHGQITKGNRRTMSHQTEHINKEVEIIKRNQIETVELKSTISEMKNSLEEIQCQKWAGRKKNQVRLIENWS